MALFVVAALMFSYGLGHGPPREVCTAHLVSVPADVAAAMTGTAAAPAPDASPAFSAPLDLPPLSPADATCLCLAVLLALMALGLAAGPRGSGLLLPPRTGPSPAPPGKPPFLPVSLASLQVLRL
jgi:hypothetical protein